MESLIFILIGFLLRGILDNLSGAYSPWQLFGYVAAVSGAVIAARLVWMFPGAYLPRLWDEKVMGERVTYPPWRWVLVVGWTGMRGVVSLAAALALPAAVDGVPFAGRDLIQFLTFWVIFATLVGQGLTLPWLIRGLRVDRDAGPPAGDEPHA